MSLQKFFGDLGASVKGAGKMLVLSRRASLKAVGHDRPLVVLGNGPSLNKTLEEQRERLAGCDLMAVNFAANAPVFSELHPKYYILADPFFFSGKDAEFSFADAYAPADFSAIRYCETRVWSFYNKWVEGMDRYLDYADGKHIGQAEPMPLYFKPKQKLSLHDVMNSMRDHYEGTPFDVTKDVGAGPYCAPYRPTPLTWEYEGKKYFNERPISTQQTAGTYVIQVRDFLPNAVGGVLWYGNDDPNMVPYTPVYCSATQAPACYNPSDADGVTFSWNSAFWVQNWVSNMTYPRYSQLFPSLQQARQELEDRYAAKQAEVERQATELLRYDAARAAAYLTDYSADCARQMMDRWIKLGQYLIVKYNDQTVKPEKDGKFELTPDGLGARPVRPGFNDSYKQTIVKETGDKYLIP